MQQTISATANTETKPLPLLFSRRNAADILKICVRKLDQLIAVGELAVIRIDGRTLLSSWELLSFIERKTMRKQVQ